MTAARHCRFFASCFLGDATGGTSPPCQDRVSGLYIQTPILHPSASAPQLHNKTSIPRQAVSCHIRIQPAPLMRPLPEPQPTGGCQGGYAPLAALRCLQCISAPLAGTRQPKTVINPEPNGSGPLCARLPLATLNQGAIRPSCPLTGQFTPRIFEPTVKILLIWLEKRLMMVCAT